MIRHRTCLSLALLALAAPAQAGELYPPITDYAGKTLIDEIDGFVLFDNPRTRDAVAAAASDPDISAQVLSTDVVASPIVGGWVWGIGLVHACEPQNCGLHNWSFVFDEASGRAGVCYFVMASGEPARWYVGKKFVVAQEGGCPSALEDVPGDVRLLVYEPRLDEDDVVRPPGTRD